MNRTTNILVIVAGLFLFGCSVPPSPQTSGTTTPPSTTPPATTPPATTPPATAPNLFQGGPNIQGNWQFSATSSAPGAHPFSIAGTVNLTYPTASGALHIDNPSCFDPLITRTLTSTQSGDTTTLTATGSDGQVVTLSGSFGGLTYNVIVNGNINTTFTGTYQVAGGCAAGDHGTVIGNYIYSIGPDFDPFHWSGTFTSSSTQQTFNATGSIVESSVADTAGSFGISGDASFDVACLSAGTIKTGSYPSGSFILGTSVGLEFDTSSGIVTFLGTLDPNTNVISGNYTVSGSSCDQTGSAVVNIPTGCPGCWDY